MIGVMALKVLMVYNCGEYHRMTFSVVYYNITAKIPPPPKKKNKTNKQTKKTNKKKTKKKQTKKNPSYFVHLPWFKEQYIL